MINNKKVLVYIPIRSGSKGIRDKNITDVCGKPLVAYAIEAAKNSKYVDKIIVSTDSEKYAKVVKQYGAEAPFLRPDYLATDTSVEIDACLHMMKWVKENWEEYDIIIKLQATSPLRTATDIDKALEKLENKQADTIISISKAQISPLWMNTLPKDESMQDFISPKIQKMNRQELPVHYTLNGYLFIARWDHLENNKSWHGGRSFAFIVDSKKALDIDEPIDLDLVRLTINKTTNQNISNKKFVSYEKVLEKYSEKKRISAKEEHKMKKVATHISPKDLILDVGAYDAAVLDYLKLEDKNQYVGVDLHKIHPQVKKCDIIKEEIPFPKNAFNKILLLDTLEHLENPLLILNKIKSHLKPDGQVIITVPNGENLTKMIVSLASPKKYLEKHNLEHVNGYGTEEIINLVCRAGFKVKQLDKINPRVDALKYRLPYWRPFLAFAGTILLVAELSNE
jgi:CMP-N,N'-diacetyllegionaminic acid synthase